MYVLCAHLKAHHFRIGAGTQAGFMRSPAAFTVAQLSTSGE